MGDPTRVIVRLWGDRPEVYWGPLDKMLDYARSQKDTGIASIHVYNHRNERVWHKAFTYHGYGCCTA